MEPGLRAAGMRNSEEVVGGHSCRAAWEKMVGGTDASEVPGQRHREAEGWAWGGRRVPVRSRWKEGGKRETLWR